MATASLNRVNQTIDGFDSIIIVKDFSDIPAGVTLDVTEVTADTIGAGHVLVRKPATETEKEIVKPLGITDGEYDALPEGFEYYGINKTSILKAVPMAAVLRSGVVNAGAAKNAIGASYTPDIKTALKHIDFIY